MFYGELGTHSWIDVASMDGLNTACRERDGRMGLGHWVNPHCHFTPFQ